jgi:hypothetical protein
MKQAQHLTLAQAAALVGRSERWISQLRERGYIATPAPGQYPIVSVLRGAMAYFEDQIARQADTARQTAATDARTREIELRIKRKAANLIPLSCVEAEFADWLPAFRAEMAGVPKRASGDPEKQERLACEIEAIMARMQDKAQAAIRRLQTGEK